MLSLRLGRSLIRQTPLRQFHNVKLAQPIKPIRLNKNMEVIKRNLSNSICPKIYFPNVIVQYKKSIPFGMAGGFVVGVGSYYKYLRTPYVQFFTDKIKYPDPSVLEFMFCTFIGTVLGVIYPISLVGYGGWLFATCDLKDQPDIRKDL